MPLIDMPLEKLKTYQGRNPKPEDHEAYWDRALAEMRSVDSQVTLEKSDFQVAHTACFDLTFTGVRGARIYAKYARPTHVDKPHPAVLIFHGYSGASPDWTHLLNYVHLGYSVAAMDCRGQGGRSEDPGGVRGTTFRGHIVRGLADKPDNLLFRHIFLDTAQLAQIVMQMPEVDEARVGVTGGSQGGGLTLACASLEPRIAMAAPTFPFLCDYQRVWEMDLAAGAYEELKTFFRQFDPTHAQESLWFTRLGYIDLQHLAGRIKAKVLMGTGLMDTICPPSTQFAAYNKIKASKEMILYPDFGHEGLPGFGEAVFQFLGEL